MRAEHQAGQARPLALVTAADIADGVKMCVHAGFAHPAHDQLCRRAVLARQEDPRQIARVLRNRRQGVDPADDRLAER